MTHKQLGRLAGFTYLLLVMSGMFSIAYVPSQLVDWTSASATFTNIVENEGLFRAGIFVGFLCYVFYILLPLVLYRLFKSVNPVCAQLMVALSVVSVPVSFYNITNLMDILYLISGSEFLSVYTAEELESQVMLLIRSYYNGVNAAMLFWGLWLFPFGYLAYKSRFVPRVFGVLLMLGCFGYVIKFSSRLLFPEFDLPSIVGRPANFGEIGICLWLLIMGAKQNPEYEDNPLKHT